MQTQESEDSSRQELILTVEELVSSAIALWSVVVESPDNAVGNLDEREVEKLRVFAEVLFNYKVSLALAREKDDSDELGHLIGKTGDEVWATCCQMSGIFSASLRPPEDEAARRRIEEALSRVKEVSSNLIDMAADGFDASTLHFIAIKLLADRESISLEEAEKLHRDKWTQ